MSGKEHQYIADHGRLGLVALLDRLVCTPLNILCWAGREIGLFDGTAYIEAPPRWDYWKDRGTYGTHHNLRAGYLTVEWGLMSRESRAAQRRREPFWMR